jgi:hypothetical protein
MKMFARKRERPFHAEREIELVLALEVDLLLFGHDRVAELLRLGGRERRELQRDDLAVDAEERRRARGDVHVARALLDHGLEELVEVTLRSDRVLASSGAAGVGAYGRSFGLGFDQSVPW